MNKIITASQALTRRSFLSHASKTVAGAAALGALPIERIAYGALSPGDTVKIALIGCGGRGSGAANQALSTSGDVKLTAIADVHPGDHRKSIRHRKAESGLRLVQDG